MSGIHLMLAGATFKSGPTTIGQAYGGGYYAGQISTTGNGVATHYLIVSPASSGQSLSKKWKLVNNDTPNTSSVINGPANSANMNNADHPAAQFCEGLTIGGYSDWYLPARDELEVCYYNLKPSTTSNNTSSGANTYAVPSRSSNYTTSNPGQTSATDFQSTGTEFFYSSASTVSYYWTSTQFSNTNAYLQRFDTGSQFNDNKDSSRSARAIRRIAV